LLRWPNPLNVFNVKRMALADSSFQTGDPRRHKSQITSNHTSHATITPPHPRPSPPSTPLYSSPCHTLSSGRSLIPTKKWERTTLPRPNSERWTITPRQHRPPLHRTLRALPLSHLPATKNQSCKTPSMATPLIPTPPRIVSSTSRRPASCAATTTD